MRGNINSFLIEILEEYRGAKRLKKAEFSRMIGVRPQTYEGWIENGRPPTPRIYATMVKVFPDVNLYWLLTGEGEMMRGVGVEESPSGSQNMDRALGWCLDELERLKAENERLVDDKKNMDQDEKETEESG